MFSFSLEIEARQRDKALCELFPSMNTTCRPWLVVVSDETTGSRDVTYESELRVIIKWMDYRYQLLSLTADPAQATFGLLSSAPQADPRADRLWKKMNGAERPDNGAAGARRG